MEIFIFRGGLDFLGPKMGPRFAQAHFRGAQKVSAPSKNEDFHGKPLEMDLVGDLHASKKYYPAFVNTEVQ